ncbi:aldehyde dehydrogenase family protein [Streptomyces sp. NPDC048565]|uniref:aldehyde dehydrogenase family protein n=1 Tax=Streptomyces sp. NPDC048565 TaxID=3155266 RepID=UPI00343BCA0B
MVLKPDPRTPVSGGLARAELLAEAGLPAGLLHVLPGGADVGEALVAHPDVPCISFTGSTPAGRAIGTAAAPLLKKVHLELGGNNALLVLPRTVEQGAELAAGGTYDGLFYRPTVLTGVPLDSPAFAEEVFGPVAPVVAYETVDEAIDLINASEYGLSVSILTGDAFAAWELADRIDSGAVHINDQTVDDEAVAPFGGTKASGTGAASGAGRVRTPSPRCSGSPRRPTSSAIRSEPPRRGRHRPYRSRPGHVLAGPARPLTASRSHV